MADMTTGDKAPNTCCAPAEQVACCEPSAKAACCGHGDGCGCEAGTTPIIRARKPAGGRV